MANLSQIAKVVISLSTATIAKANFGIPLIVSPTSGFAERVRIYSNYDAAVEDRLDAKTLRAVNSAFGQTPRPSVVYVGRRDLTSTTVTTNINTVNNGNIFSMNVDGVSVSYTAKTGDNVEAVFTGLAAAFAASPAASDKYNIEASAVSLVISPKDTTQSSVITMTQNLVDAPQGDAANIAADLTKINRANKAWYGFMLTERSDTLLLQAAIWAEAQTKIFFACSGSAAIWDAESDDDIASNLQKGQYFRTALIAHKEASDYYPEAAWMGRCFTIEPGGEVWALKVLSTIPPSDFSDTEQAVIWGKGANTYEQYSDNVYLTNPGKVSAGEWIDIIRGRDYAVDTIQKDMASAQIRAKKIPYTNPGIQICVNTVRGSLVKLQRAGVLAPDEVNSDGETVPGFQISYPNAADVDASTKATRRLYLTFVGLLAGAIQITDITGTLAYNYDEAA